MQNILNGIGRSLLLHLFFKFSGADIASEYLFQFTAGFRKIQLTENVLAGDPSSWGALGINPD